ncbi:MAG: DUF1553 domain-containing protein [Planctomycetales bacterium]|nr:DUF1553 domain-containing protein [Planctomycetales bacterium]
MIYTDMSLPIHAAVLPSRKSGPIASVLTTSERCRSARHGLLIVWCVLCLSSVTAAGESANDPVEFGRHVLPVLTKAGCNSGACHGALAGKGGFKLSLRGYDPVGDYFSITQESRGRRIELAEPGRSLLLAKPTTALPHKGGRRLSEDSEDYRVLAEWITAGIKPPTDEDARLTHIEVLPETMLLQPEDQHQLVVRAHYSDNRIEDVTRWAKYSSANATVAHVDDDGKLTVTGSGQGAIVVWFSSQIVLATVTVPYPNEVPPETYDRLASANFIDELVHAKLKELRLPPSLPTDDATFLRRAYLDTIGTLPTADELTTFLDSTNANKREQVVDALLAREEFIDYWTLRWSDILLLNGQRLRPVAIKAYYEWLRGHVANNSPWDLIVRDVVTATGASNENGATNFYALHQSPEEMAENVSQAFLGLSIGCAKCHNHPLEKWTNNQYYAMANLFARVRAKGWGGDGRNGDGIRTLMIAQTGELIQPLTGRPQPPAPLDGEPLAFDDRRDRRAHLADWLTSPENPYFSRAIANRVWQNFFGVGLVEQVDDLRVSNPASNPELMHAVSEYVIEHHFDLKPLMRAILLSHTYQRSSVPVAGNEEDQRFYSRYYPRRLMAEVLLDAVSQVTEVPTEFTQIRYDGADIQATKEYPLGTRAIQLHDSAVLSKFLSTFGRNKRDIVCECERSNKPSMVQVLHINNGATINGKLSAADSCVDRALAMGDWTQAIQSAYLGSLSRYPTASEQEQLAELLHTTPEEERRLALEDLYWSLLSSREFMFNH